MLGRGTKLGGGDVGTSIDSGLESWGVTGTGIIRLVVVPLARVATVSIPFFATGLMGLSCRVTVDVAGVWAEVAKLLD